MDGSSIAYRRRSPPPGRNATQAVAMDSSSSAYGRPKTPKSMGLGMPGTRGLMDEPTSMGNGDGASGVDGFDVYPPQGASVEAANSGFVYSTTLRRQASTDYVPGRTRSRSPVTYRDHDYTAYTPRARSASLRESIEGVAESGVLGKVASSIRKAVGADEVPYQRLAASSVSGGTEDRAAAAKETPSAIYAHKSIEASSTANIASHWNQADRIGSNQRLFHTSDKRPIQFPATISGLSIWFERI